MTQFNIIKCQMVPVHPDFLAELPDHMYERLDDNSVVLNEGVRVILMTRPQTEEEVIGNWSKLRELKEKSNEDQ